MSADILGTSCDQCRSMVQYSFTSTETRRLVRTDSPGRPPRLSHSSFDWTFVSRVISFLYDVRVRGVVLMFNETAHSFFVWGSSWASAALTCCCRLNGLYRVQGLRVSSLCPVARWHFLPPLSFQKVFLFLSLFLFFSTMRSFFFISGLSWPFRTRLLACLIRAAILHFSFRLHLFTSRCFVIGSPD